MVSFQIHCSSVPKLNNENCITIQILLDPTVYTSHAFTSREKYHSRQSICYAINKSLYFMGYCTWKVDHYLFKQEAVNI